VQSRVRDAAKDAQLGLQKLQDALDALGLDTRGLSTEGKLAKKKTGTPAAQAKELCPRPAGAVHFQPVLREEGVGVRRASARVHGQRDGFHDFRDDGQFPVVHATFAVLPGFASGSSGSQQQVAVQHSLQHALASANLPQQHTISCSLMYVPASSAPGGNESPKSVWLAAASAPLAAPPGGSNSSRSAWLAAASVPLAAPPGAMRNRGYGKFQQLRDWKDRELSGALVGFMRWGNLPNGKKVRPEVAKGDKGWHHVEDLAHRLSQIGPGVAWQDFDGDGWDDLVVASGKGAAPVLGAGVRLAFITIDSRA
jgi:hypothetical protein